MAEPITLTMDDIRYSPTLQELGAVAGDQVVNKKIVRKFSDENSSTDLGYRVTDQDIESSETLQSLGANPGDRIVDKKLISSESDDVFRQFMYGFDNTGKFTNYVSDALEARIPLGSFDITSFNYLSPDEVYGEGFSDSDVATRREMIERKRERDIMSKYGPYFEEASGSTANTIGTIAGALADPTSFLPVGLTIKGGAAIGAGLGAGYSVAQDVATTGEIDPMKAALSTALGGAGGAAFPAAGRAIGAVRNKSSKRVSNRNIDEAERIANEHVAAGGSVEGALEEIAASPLSSTLGRDIEIAGRKPRITPSRDRAEEALQYNITEDSATARVMNKKLDYFIGALSTRVGNISQPILRKLRDFEYNIHTKSNASMVELEPFLRQLQKLKGPAKQAVTRHLYNGEFSAAKSYMPKEMQGMLPAVETKLGSFYDELKDVGYTFDPKENYFPRIVKDYDGLLKAVGSKKKSAIAKAQQEYARAKDLTVSDLDMATKSNIANMVIRGFGVKIDGNLPNFVKPRTIEKLDDNLLKYYSSPEEALTIYARNAVNNIERRTFLGRSLKKDQQGIVDLDSSIGRMVEEEKLAGRILPEQEDELVSLLKSRFIGGEKTSGKLLGTVRDLTYMGTIANPISAITQLGDIGLSGALNGFRNTIVAMFGPKSIKTVDIGIDSIGQEFTDARKTAKLLNKLFTVSFFRAIDRLGKETFMNASLRKNFKLMKTSSGEAAFRKKWGKFYGDDIESIVADFKGGKVTEPINVHTFSELSNIQPISMIETPQAYLDHPNGRILYALKTFTLKQYDVVRKEIVQEYQNGNKLAATKKAAVLAGYLSAANVGTDTIKNILLNRDVSVDDLPNKSLWALTGVFGVNKYVSDKYISQGKITDAAIETLAPATPIIDAITEGAVMLTDEDADASKLLRSVPLFGPILYNYFGGGLEKYNERMEKERRGD
jgi:hypothetical protein